MDDTSWHAEARWALWLRCSPQGLLLAVYRATGICNQVSVDLSFPLQDTVLSSPMPEIRQQAVAPCLHVVTLNNSSVDCPSVDIPPFALPTPPHGACTFPSQPMPFLCCPLSLRS